jgi:hypothetical protein
MPPLVARPARSGRECRHTRSVLSADCSAPQPGDGTLTQAETAQPPSATCGNCGATIGGAYCPVCGQDTRLEPSTVAEYLHELLAHFGHLKGRLLAHPRDAFLSPGKAAPGLPCKQACALRQTAESCTLPRSRSRSPRSNSWAGIWGSGSAAPGSI